MYQAKLLVDRNARHRNAPIEFQEAQFYGRVDHYFIHQYGESSSMLAYVQWVGSLTDSGHGVRTFQQWGAYEVINVSAIDRCVGFLELTNKQHAIIDRESQVRLR